MRGRRAALTHRPCPPPRSLRPPGLGTRPSRLPSPPVGSPDAWGPPAPGSQRSGAVAAAAGGWEPFGTSAGTAPRPTLCWGDQQDLGGLKGFVSGEEMSARLVIPWSPAGPAPLPPSPLLQAPGPFSPSQSCGEPPMPRSRPREDRARRPGPGSPALPPPRPNSPPSAGDHPGVRAPLGDLLVAPASVWQEPPGPAPPAGEQGSGRKSSGAEAGGWEPGRLGPLGGAWGEAGCLRSLGEEWGLEVAARVGVSGVTTGVTGSLDTWVPS